MIKKQFHEVFNALSVANSILGGIALLELIPFGYVWFAAPFAISHLIVGYFSKVGMFEYRSWVSEDKIPDEFVKINENEYRKRQ